MSLAHPCRLLLLAAVAVIAAAALLHDEVDAATLDKTNWNVTGPETLTGDSITLSGALNIRMGAILELVGCDLTLTNPNEGSTTMVVDGTLVLDGSSVNSLKRTRLVIGGTGSLRVSGTVKLLRLDVYGESMGAINVANADLTVTGQDITSPGLFESKGPLTMARSTVSLRYIQMLTSGTVGVSNSTVMALDWGFGGYRRLALTTGDVALRDCVLRDLFNGVSVDASLTAERTTFTSADLLVEPTGRTERLEVDLRSCTFTSSTVSIRERMGVDVLPVDVWMDHVTIDAGRVEVNLTSPTTGAIQLRWLTITGALDYAVRVRLASGIAGTLEMRDIDVSDGSYGIQVLEDFSGLVIDNVTVDVRNTALELAGRAFPPPATLTGVRVSSAQRGIIAKRAALDVTMSDLRGADEPVRVEDAGSVKMLDCTLDERAAVVEPTSPGALAALYVHRTINVSGAYWIGAGDISSGEVVLKASNASETAENSARWTIGSKDFPNLRILEWWVENDLSGGATSRHVEFHDLFGALERKNHVFKTPEPVDPWLEGPYDLLFEDDVPPEITLDASVRTSVNEPHIPLFGTVSDLGSGLDYVQWVLKNPDGSTVSSGDLSLGRWSELVNLTANYQRVRIEAWDASGGYSYLDTSPILVDVAPPSLTVLSPTDGELTNSPYITVSGRAESYANLVVLRIGDQVHEFIVVAEGDDKGFFYGTPIRLPHEGMVELLLTSLDPFGNVDEKRVVVIFDQTPPQMEVLRLREDVPNYVNVPVLVVEGRVDDAKARIRIADQVVGVLEADRTFATSVELHEGRQTVRVEAWDVAGNHEAINIEVVLDTAAPRITLVSPASNPYYTSGDSVTVEVFTSETLSRMTRDGIPMTLAAGRLTFRHEFPQDGKREFVLVATDLAGNEGRLTVTLVRDTEPPRLNIISPKDGEIVNQVTVQLLAHVSETGCALLVNGLERESRELSSGQLTADLALLGGDGPRSVTIAVRDRAGNLDEVVLDLELDTEAPGIAVDDLHNNSRVTTEPLKVSGRTEPMAKVVWVNDVMADLGPDGTFTTTIELPRGQQMLRISVLDKAGNQGDLILELEVLEAPALDIPWEVAAAGTILVAFGAIFASTEVGRWGLVTLFLPLYTKLRKDKILDQRTRGLIQGYILANPGCNYTLLRDNLDLADGTLTYHLQVLEREGFVYSIREGLFRCFYPTGLPPPRRGKLHLSDTQADIVRICKRIPGITVGEIATAMNRRPNVISYHLKLLREGGLITLEEDGRHVRVYPVEAAVAMI